MALYAAESLGESLCVAVFAAGTNLAATADRVPGCVGPFNTRIGTHWFSPYGSLKPNAIKPFNSGLLRCDPRNRDLFAFSGLKDGPIVFFYEWKIPRALS